MTRMTRSGPWQRSGQTVETGLFDHLVGAAEQCHWHIEAECLRSLEIDEQLILCRRLHRQLAGSSAFEDAVDVVCRRTKLLRVIGAIGDQAAEVCEFPLVINRRKA